MNGAEALSAWFVELDAAVEEAKAEILADVKSGRVPRDVTSFGDLHDHVDANEYGGLCGERFDIGFANDSDFANAVQHRLDEWIKTGALRPRPPARDDIDLTKAQAQALADLLAEMVSPGDKDEDLSATLRDEEDGIGVFFGWDDEEGERRTVYHRIAADGTVSGGYEV